MADVGRPSKYTSELGDLICQGISECKSLVRICEDETLPVPQTVYRWLRTNEEFRSNYDYAKSDQAHAMAEEIVDIADNEAEEVLLVDGIPMQVDGLNVMTKTPTSIAHAKLRTDVRKWAASKYDRKYQDKQITELEGTVTLEKLSDEEVELRFAAAQAKMDD